MSIEHTPVRLSHLLGHSSVGAIVRAVEEPKYLMVIKDIREWTKSGGKPAGDLIPYVDGVRSSLGIEQELRKPPVAKKLESGTVVGDCIPAVRFPAWMRCPNCGFLFHKPWKGVEWDAADKLPRCTKCEKQPELNQVLWLIAHPDGHLADVPWHYLTHREAKTEEQGRCRENIGQPHLRLRYTKGLTPELECMVCRASAPFSANNKVPFGRAGKQPWIRESPTLSPHSELATLLEVNDSRVHSAVTVSALVIPPESQIRRNTVVDRIFRNSRLRYALDKPMTDLQKRIQLSLLKDEFRCTEAEIIDAREKIEQGYPLYGKSITPAILLEKEYGALTTPISDNRDDEDLVTIHHTHTWKSSANESGNSAGIRREIIRAFHQVVAVHRLKEIRVLKGFSRMNGEVIVPPDIEGMASWLPAIELFGEGVFITLDEEILSSWEAVAAVVRRTAMFRDRFVAANLSFHPEVTVSPRFLFLHTLSHLLIRQLEAEAGYPAASLKERIFCSSGSAKMAGMLVYVAVPDVAGSLGGLAELAEPRRLLRLLSDVFERAQWCSMDPVCREHQGQGPALLNRAACHGCALIPEPSCSCGNVLLDRSFLKGWLPEGGARGKPAGDGMLPFLDFVGTLPACAL
ncbi:MAG: DUF1998 domain-containing protein [Verrucomicrobia bacterium]|nr:DUF1998 domain-containing protein [Verrucomicrobiota bacterium]